MSTTESFKKKKKFKEKEKCDERAISVTSGCCLLLANAFL